MQRQNLYQGIPPTPDRSFVRQLKEFDKTLDVVFNRRARRFMIVKERAYGAPYTLMLVEAEDGGFRHPDQRELHALFYGDLWRHGGHKERIRKGEERAVAHQAKQEKDIDQEFRDITADNKIQLRNTWRKATNQGSKAPEFARLAYRNPGLTVDQIRTARASGQDPWARTAKVA